MTSIIVTTAAGMELAIHPSYHFAGVLFFFGSSKGLDLWRHRHTHCKRPSGPHHKQEKVKKGEEVGAVVTMEEVLPTLNITNQYKGQDNNKNLQVK